MKRTLGIIDFESKFVNIDGISIYRPIPSVSFCGRFRLIDFVVSNMTNSFISNIQVHVSSKQRSVFTHIGSGRQYNINSKRGKITVMHGESSAHSEIFNTDINSFWDNFEHIINSPEEYVLIAPCCFVYAQSYADMIEKHEASGADITVLYKSVDNANEKFIDCNNLTITKNKKIEKIERNRGRYKNRDISMDCYVLSKKLFVELIKRAHKTSASYWFVDIVSEVLDELNVMGYSLKHEVLALTSLEEFFSAHMAMIDYHYAKKFFLNDWPIMTRTYNSPPVFYGKEARVKNCSVSNGSKINGNIENCFIGRNVTIEKGAVVKNSVILTGAFIGENAIIDHAVLDKRAEVKIVKTLVGDKKNIIYVNRGNTV